MRMVKAEIAVHREPVPAGIVWKIYGIKIIINVADFGIDYRKSSDVGSHLVDVNLCGIAETRGNTCTVDLARTLIQKYIAQWKKPDPKSKFSKVVDLERLKKLTRKQLLVVLYSSGYAKSFIRPYFVLFKRKTGQNVDRLERRFKVRVEKA